MSFSIILYKNTSDANHVTKTLNRIETVIGTLREETSIIDPHFMINIDLSTIVQCNYCEVPAFGRKYFVRDIVSYRNELVELSCHCDVLSTFWNYISNNKAIVYRQETTYNLYLDDGAFRIYQNPQIVYKEFPNGFTSENFVLAIAGPYGTSS